MAEDIQIRREIVLEADAEMLQKMRKEGRAGCYVLQTILHPVPVERQLTLNGNHFDPETLKNRKEKEHG